MTFGHLIVAAIATAWITFSYLGCLALYELVNLTRRIRITRKKATP